MSETVLETEKEGEEEDVTTSILELYSALSGANAHFSCTSASARTLAAASVALVVSETRD